MFIFTRTAIPDIIHIRIKPILDNRGFFCEAYREEDFSKFGIPKFLQENHSKSAIGTIRGLHYQEDPAAIGKLVRCVRGKIFDVAVDIRKGSRTFGKFYSQFLTSDSFEMLYIPPGFAHGFCAVEDNSEIIYKTTGYYSKEHDRAVRWNDPNIGIQWPNLKYIISEKDANAKMLGEI